MSWAVPLVQGDALTSIIRATAEDVVRASA
jgi:hypothetical protein